MFDNKSSISIFVTFQRLYVSLGGKLSHAMVQCGLVYQVEYPECPVTVTYILGEAGRTLATRMKDRLNLRNPLTAVGEHCAHEHHKITQDSVRVLAREDIWFKRKVREAIKIKIGQPATNSDQGYELPHLR